MIAKISNGGKGSCIGLVQYLEKEGEGNWFTHDKGNIDASQVTSSIDANRKHLGQQDDKYYQVILSPSQSELNHLGNNRHQMEAFTRGAMDQYASQFGKGIKSTDLVWFAKIEQARTFSHTDKAVQQQQRVEGESKEGPQTHVHIIVSRTEDLTRYQQKKQAGEIDRKHPLKLSPATNHRATSQGAVQGGFDRTEFKQAVEAQFDRQFGYQRPLTETFNYANTLQKGSQEERLALRLEALKQQPNHLNWEQSKVKSSEVEREKDQDRSKENFTL
ncbi:DUF5712 family protein [Spirosoma pollinicola]|uniref:Mobilization protein n=1 Tax=Spirosoma pollinicola TaxID=2057025 RepID=A0A2K8ZA44_9BACT|nr:DUF5712 family protein [Spirosoma pollinicola]AUD06720.1 hypothetical protein CWM47_35680 [Spirosoma pollinicola]